MLPFLNFSNTIKLNHMEEREEEGQMQNKTRTNNNCWALMHLGPSMMAVCESPVYPDEFYIVILSNYLKCLRRRTLHLKDWQS